MGNAQTKRDSTLAKLYKRKEMCENKKVSLIRQAGHIKSLRQLNTRALKEVVRKIAEIEKSTQETTN
jgi:galactokinase